MMSKSDGRNEQSSIGCFGVSLRRGHAMIVCAISLAMTTMLAIASVATASAPHTVVESVRGSSGAGQLAEEGAVAVDTDPLSSSYGDFYVSDDNRIDKFTAAGEFVLAFGWGVANGTTKSLQVCTSTCFDGIKGEEDSVGDPLNSSYMATDPTTGDVYISEEFRHRVEKFSPSGQFLLAFGGGVNKTTGGDVCTAEDVDVHHDVCGPGTKGTGQGELDDGTYYGSPIAVDSAGNVWIAGYDRIEEFSSEGSYVKEFPTTLQAPSESLAVDTDPLSPSYGDLYITTYITTETEAEKVPREVIELSQNGVVQGELDVEQYPDTVTVDPDDGNVFVGDLYEPSVGTSHGQGTLQEYSPEGTEQEVFGGGEVLGAVYGQALSLDPSTGSLYASNGCSSRRVGNETVEMCSVQAFSEPAPGPEFYAKSLEAEHIGGGGATLVGSVNPEDYPTEYHFEYLPESTYKQNVEEKKQPFTGATTAVGGSIPANFEYHSLSTKLSGLTGETIYHYRLNASNECEPVSDPGHKCALAETGSEEATFETLPPLHIESTYATAVTDSSVTLGAQIDPLGLPTYYHFEYVSEVAYQENIHLGREPLFGSSVLPSSDVLVGEGEEGVAVSQELYGLSPATGYRYRLVAHNTAGLRYGPIISLRTQGLGGSLLLPDDRGWEMVSPVEKNGGGVSTLYQGPFTELTQAAPDGDAVTYGSNTSFAGVSSPTGSQYLAVRGEDGGWSTQNINMPTNSGNYEALGDPPYKAFSEDLSTALISSGDKEGNGISPPLPGTEAQPGLGNFYIRDNLTGALQAALTESEAQSREAELPLEFDGATPDLHHILFVDTIGPAGKFKHDLYEWTEGDLEALNLFPGHNGPTAGTLGAGGGEPIEHEGERKLNDPRAISSNGTRVVWTGETASGPVLYLRENVGEPQSAFGPHGECVEPGMACTVEVDARQGGEGKSGGGEFLAASTDDSSIFFADHERLTVGSTAGKGAKGDLYEFQPEAPEGQHLTDLTIDHTDPSGAGVLGVMAASEDGSYIYFVANGVLATNQGADGTHASLGDCKQETETTPGTVGQSCNLYLYHEGAVTFVATVSGADNTGFREEEPSGTEASDWQDNMISRSVRLSADGRKLLFMSHRSLTGYDNTVATGSQCEGTPWNATTFYPAQCAELFLYEAPSGGADSGHLSCISCNPTGERPLGPSGISYGDTVGHYGGIYDSRAMSEDGTQIFFDSYDSLVPQDSNGKLDVYEWEKAGHGTCLESSEAFVRSSDGCVSLISSGISAEDSDFTDAAADGSNVFFVTAASLSPRDPGGYDLYDARVGGGEQLEASRASCEGDACQSPPVTPIDQTPGSLTFTGMGNPPPTEMSTSVSTKKRTVVGNRAQRLAKGLRACRSKRGRARALCETRVRKKFGSKDDPRTKRAARKIGRDR